MLKILTFLIVGYIIYRYFSSSKSLEEPLPHQEEEDSDFVDYEEID